MDDGALWRKATYSNQTGNCVEVGRASGAVLVRDTKTGGTSPVLRVTPANWKRFAASVKR